VSKAILVLYFYKYKANYSQETVKDGTEANKNHHPMEENNIGS